MVMKGDTTITDIDGRARRVDCIRRRLRIQGHRQDQLKRNRQRGCSRHLATPYAGPCPVVNHVAPAAPVVAAPLALLMAPQPWFTVVLVSVPSRGPSGIWWRCGHGAALGLGYGAGILGAGIGKALITNKITKL
ncbi:hypothetical protein CEXT_52021 [Caerostris extrusa]|uniref:Uncharacterized protein n=1 Tax=Caerostris extrusa TaxID=172846 RepID=A0AAV4PT40_CAEEX|nr:hypothetical protein CEXT_52021 [Caerostris extrusa]